MKHSTSCSNVNPLVDRVYTLKEIAACGCRNFNLPTLHELLNERAEEYRTKGTIVEEDLRNQVADACEKEKELRAKFDDLTEAYHDTCFKRDYWHARSDAARVYAEQMASRVAMVEKRWADLVIAQSTLSRLPRDEYGYIKIPYQIIEDMARVAAS